MSDRSLVRTAFPQSVVERAGYFVYRLVDPRDGTTFYVGKGVGNRIFEHVAEAVGNSERATLKLERIREIEASGHKVRHLVHRHGLSESEAFLVESALNDAYDELANAQLGHAAHANGMTTVDDLVALYDVGPAEVNVPAVLLNLNRQYDRALTPDELYERTRGHWVMRPHKHPSVKHAMATAYGIIREVYAVDSWTSTPVDEIVESDLRRVDEAENKSKTRCAFVRSVAHDLRDRFVGKSVPGNSQNPVRWMNC